MPKQNRGLFSFDRDVYNPEALSHMPRNTLAAEYNRLRKEANKRLAQFDGTEWTQTGIYKSNAGKYDQNIRKMTAEELAYKLSDVQSFLDNKLSTVRGLQIQRAKAVRSLGYMGYDFVNKKNFIKFTEFMDFLREEKYVYGKGSPDDKMQKFFRENQDKTIEEIKKGWKEYAGENKPDGKNSNAVGNRRRSRGSGRRGGRKR